jgi:hypothetical protein
VDIFLDYQRQSVNYQDAFGYTAAYPAGGGFNINIFQPIEISGNLR